MKYLLAVFTVILGLGSITAQSFIGKLQTSRTAGSVLVNSTQPDTLRILAVMADFQTDRDGTTFGNGKFGSIYSQDYGKDILDPLPHDKNYFESHLQFVKNYFSKVSNGKLTIEYTVLPGIVTVSKTMRNYSPPSASDDFTLLADFNREVWKLVDSANPGFDFSKFNLFTIFHAGVGRDIALPGTLGNEHNLPSIYFSPASYKKIYGASFDGFSVGNGSFKIDNTIVMPETENREVSNGLTTSFFQLTTNGLMAANIGSALGLPDLFNTKTGESAIGRFGLMDPQAFFSYQGVFPPEPSPWAKIYLGWATTVTLSPGNYSDINVVARLASTLADTVILKVPINSREYYLVENRNRDVNKDGVTVTYLSNGVSLNKTFYDDTSKFSNYDVSGINGVVTDADEFDWALPGSGILIWHIDKNIIDKNLADNSINAGAVKGVYVEEADGVQDVGQKFYDIFGDEVILDGTPDDFWYKSNPAPEFYQNKFGPNTTPSSNSNTGANSLLTISGFSEIGNKMNLNVAYGDSVIQPLFSFPMNLGKITDLTVAQDGDSSLIGALTQYKNLEVFRSNADFVYGYTQFSEFHPAAITGAGFTAFVGCDSTSMNVCIFNNGNIQATSGYTLGSPATAPPVVRTINPGQYQILIGAANGKIYLYNMPDPPNTLPVLADSVKISDYPVKKIAADGNYFSAIAGDILYNSDGGQVMLGSQAWDLALTKNSGGKYVAIVSVLNRIYMITGGKIESEYKVQNEKWHATNTGFAVADLKNDGNNYIIFPDSDRIVAININGASADNFSFTDPQGINFTGKPVAADLAGDSKSEILCATIDGRIFAVDGGTGKVVNGFPITTGSGLTSTPALFEKDKKLSIIMNNSDGYFSAWKIGATSGSLYWASENGNGFNSSFIGAANGSKFIGTYFPASRAYNYPNPVYGNTTNIRYYVSEDSQVDIKIFDLAGSFVDELKDFAPGGLDHETIWNVSNVQSGIYLARIQVTSSGGKSESKIIKIAVVK